VNEAASLIDSNVWIALSFNSHPAHEAASDALALASADRRAAFCRATQQSLLRLLTTPALARQYGELARTNDEALSLLDRFMASPLVTYQEEPAELFPIWRQLAGRSTAAPGIWMDAYLAAFAIAGGMTVVTLDRGFASFEQAGLSLLLLS
jgi:toxin-antitoxin system PIN domain toxin